MKKKFKFIITVTLITAVLFYRTTICNAAAFVPSIPYIPPADVQMFDLIYNAYGVTSTNTQIQDATKRMQAYLDLYSRVLGQSNQAFLQDLQNVFNNAKTSRKLVLNKTLSQQLQQGMKEALSNGILIPSDAQQPTTKAQFIQRFKELGIVNPETLLDRLWQYYGVNTGYFVYSSIQIAPDPWVVVMAFQGSPSSMISYTVSSDNKITISQGQATSANVKLNTFNATQSNEKYTILGFRGESNRTLPMTWSKNTGLHANLAVTMDYANVSAQSTEVRQAIDNSQLVPITKHTIVDNGVIDDTKPVVIDLPINMPVPSDNVQDLTNVQDDLGVVPISQNPAETVQQLQDVSAAQFGDVYDYSIDLTSYFPFCIPFDIGYAISIFAADPAAPSFDWVFPVGYENGEIVYDTFNIDLSVFDSVALILRKCLDVLFIIGLGMITRDKFLRG